MILNVRGTNGSGKSTLAFTLLGSPETRATVPLADYTVERKNGPSGRSVAGYAVPERDLIIVGRYSTACGGCDGIPTQDLVKRAVMRARELASNVFFEGIIVSTLYRGYQTLSNELKGRFDDPLTWAYLDTPLEICLERIQARNGDKPIKTELVANKIKSIQSTRRKAEQAGERVITIPWQESKAWIGQVWK